VTSVKLDGHVPQLEGRSTRDCTGLERCRPVRDGDAYAQYMRGTGMAGYKATPGHVLALMLRHDLEDACEFLMISLWESMDSIRAFAGMSRVRRSSIPKMIAFS
jgi:hypothetical protein